VLVLSILILLIDFELPTELKGFIFYAQVNECVLGQLTHEICVITLCTTHTYAHACTCMRTHVCTHTHAHTHIRTYIHRVYLLLNCPTPQVIGLVYRPYITIQEPGNSIDVSGPLKAFIPTVGLSNMPENFLLQLLV